MIDFQKEARGLIEGRVLFDVPMRKYTSLKVGGPAECLLFPKNTKELRKVILHARRKRIPLFILGKGTNLIVRDRGMSGWVVSLTQGMKRIRMDGECLEAEAGCSLQQLVQFSVQMGLSGLEPFFGIPGTVGGGLAMNAGAWGVEMKDVVDSVTWMKENGEVVERLRSKLQFSYRSLTLPSSSIILKGSFQLKRGKREESLERVKSYSEQRKRTQPLDYPSAGSILVILTDQAGLYSADPRHDSSATLLTEVRAGDPHLELIAGGAASQIARGGMITKVLAVKRTARSGAHTIIASGREQDVLVRLAQGERLGTQLLASTEVLTARKQWLPDHLQVKGWVQIDDGAVRALVAERKSLLPIGVIEVHGDFSRGDVITCVGPDRREIARGLANYGSEHAQRIARRPSAEIEAVLGFVEERELIHRDNLVIL